MTRLDPNYALTWFNKGIALHDHGKYDEAIKAYNEALRLDPNNAEAWYNKGNAFNDQGKYDKAIKAFDEAIRLNPNHVDAWNNKGTALKNQKKYDDAIKAYDEAIKLDPNLAVAWNNKGTALYDGSGTYDEAIKCYDEAIRLDPNLAEAWNNKCIILFDARLKEINVQFVKIGKGSIKYPTKEINELPKILQPDEVVGNIVPGTYDGRNGILVATNKRLFFVEKRDFWGCNVDNFLYYKITSFQYEAGLLMSTIKIHTSWKKANIKNVPNEEAKEFADFVREKISSHSNAPIVVMQPQQQSLSVSIADKLRKLATLKDSSSVSIADELRELATLKDSSSVSIADELRKLAALKDEGLISAEEFTILKSKLLNQK